MNIWHKRLLRLWLILLLPSSIYFAYAAYDNYKSIGLWQDSVNKWHDSLYPATPSKFEPLFSFNERKKLFDDAVDVRDEKIRNSERYFIISIVLFCLPIILWVLSYSAKWVWSVKND